MVEVCQHHSDIVESVGEIKGTVKMIHAEQTKMSEAVDEIRQAIAEQKTTQAVEKQKIQPFYIVVGIVAIVVFTKIGEKIIEWIGHALKG